MNTKTTKWSNAVLITALSCCAVALFVLLFLFDWDILYFIQNHIRNPFLDVVVPFYTQLGEDGIIWITFGIVLMLFKKTRKCGFLVLIGLLAGALIGNEVIKPIVARTRPCYTDGVNIALLVPNPSQFSFPSGHTVAASVSAATIAINHKKIGYFAIPMAILMGLSRLYVFVHFPTDVYAGAALGIGIAFLINFIQKKITQAIANKKQNKEHAE